MSFSSKDVNAVYEANRYVEMLYDLGWQLEFIGDDNSFHLYHPDVDAPSLPGEKAQINVMVLATAVAVVVTAGCRVRTALLDELRIAGFRVSSVTTSG